MTNKLKQYIGDKAFYKAVLALSVPIMVQNGITNFVNLLDNIMVGRIGTESMSGVAIVNQFIFVFNLLVFGAVSAAGIFTSQYFGLGDKNGVRNTFRTKLVINAIATVVAIGVFIVFDDQLISLFLHSGSAEGDLSYTLHEGKKYLSVMLIGLMPYAISQAYASTMRETGETILPMYASAIAVAVNFLLNLVLIFGLLGFPALGVVGAAVATVISRFAELFVLVVFGHRNKEKYGFLVGAYRSFRIPRILIARVISKGLPLMANEFFWSLAVTMRNQCYSTRGLDAVAAQNINATALNLFNVIYMAIGSSIAIIVGKELGAGRIDEAKATAKKMMTFCIFTSVGLGLLMSATAFVFPSIYNTGDGVRALATFMMIVSGVTMPFCAYAFSAYFTMRSGGKVLVTLLFDSVYMWVVVMPLTAALSYLTNMDIRLLFVLCQSTEVIKVLFGVVLMKKGNWAKQLVSSEDDGKLKN